jgi:Zn finger protein HypA/HybF involved in hydrogenase expression
MHEASLVRDLVRKAEQIVLAEGALRATEVVVAQGRLGHVSLEHLRSHFATAAAGTTVDGAHLDLCTRGESQELRLVSVTVEDG